MQKTGIDISKSRLDDLDKKAILFSLKNNIKNPSKKFADFGCGSGKLSICISSFGYHGYLFDLKNYKKRFRDLAISMSIKIDYSKAKIQDINYYDFPKKLDFVISQRTLHYLEYKQVKSFLKKVKKNLNPGGRVFISFSGIKSELGRGYEAEEDISKRFFKLSTDNQTKFEIRKPICLYSKKNVQDLFKEFCFKEVELWESDFGNIKAIYEKS